MAHLSGYSKYKVLTLTGGADGALTDHQLKITVSYEAAMQGDFDDIRFTQADGTTLIDAWAELIVTDTSATVWVEFPTTPANTVEQTYYMYYGNAGAASDWDIGNTFLFSDDFEDGSVTDWTTAMTIFEAGITVAKHGSYSLKTYSDAWQYGYKSFSSINYPIACDFWVYPTSADATQQFGIASAAVSDRTNAIYAEASGLGYFRSFNGTSWTLWGFNYSANQWYHVRLVVYPATDTFDAYVDNMVTPLQTGLGIWGTFDGTIQSFYLRNSNTTQYYDTIFIHKYAANPPTYAFGAEQSVSTGHPTMKRWGGIPGMQYTGRRSW